VIIGETTIVDNVEPPGDQEYCEAPDAVKVEVVVLPVQRLAGEALTVVGGTKDRATTLEIGLQIPGGFIVNV